MRIHKDTSSKDTSSKDTSSKDGSFSKTNTKSISSMHMHTRREGSVTTPTGSSVTSIETILVDDVDALEDSFSPSPSDVCLFAPQNVFCCHKVRSGIVECVLLLPNVSSYYQTCPLLVFSYERLCSLPTECVLLLQNVFSY